MSVIAASAIAGGLIIGGTVAIASAIITAVSIKYQQRQQEKLQDKINKAVEEAKGFQIVTEGEVVNIPLVYGRARIGGNRVYHKTSNIYTYADAHPDGIILTSSGDQRQESTITNSATIISGYTGAYYSRGGNIETKAGNCTLAAGYFVSPPKWTGECWRVARTGSATYIKVPLVFSAPLTRDNPNSTT